MSYTATKKSYNNISPEGDELNSYELSVYGSCPALEWLDENGNKYRAICTSLSGDFVKRSIVILVKCHIMAKGRSVWNFDQSFSLVVDDTKYRNSQGQLVDFDTSHSISNQSDIDAAVGANNANAQSIFDATVYNQEHPDSPIEIPATQYVEVPAPFYVLKQGYFTNIGFYLFLVGYNPIGAVVNLFDPIYTNMADKLNLNI